jgi:molybdate/tungstate transport system substrate-binding protein
MSEQPGESQHEKRTRFVDGRSRRDVLKAASAAGMAALAGCTGSGGGGSGNGTNVSGGGGSGGTATSGGTSDRTPTGGETTGGGGAGGSTADSITMFHAGSLAPPMEEAEAQFEEQTDIQVNREAEGSIASTQKITQQGRSADVLGVSDYRLIRDMVIPQFGNWYALFATNAMTIAYTQDSAGAGEIGPDNWWEILARDDVRFAHSDPAADPNGYRSVMTMQLGTMEFRGNTLYGQDTYNTLREKEIVPTGTETALIGQLQAGTLDYAWQYESTQATNDVQTVDLQPWVDLSRATPEFAQFYSNAKVQAGGSTYVGAPIAYGITVPGVAEAPQAGAQFVAFVTGNAGDTIMNNAGFSPVNPAVVPQSARNAVPQPVMENAEARQSLGPLELDIGRRPIPFPR